MQPSQNITCTEHRNSALVCAKGCGFLTHGCKRQPGPTVILVLGTSRMVKIHFSAH